MCFCFLHKFFQWNNIIAYHKWKILNFRFPSCLYIIDKLLLGDIISRITYSVKLLLFLFSQSTKKNWIPKCNFWNTLNSNCSISNFQKCNSSRQKFCPVKLQSLPQTILCLLYFYAPCSILRLHSEVGKFHHLQNVWFNKKKQTVSSHPFTLAASKLTNFTVAFGVPTREKCFRFWVDRVMPVS